jgi:hypothetical protein
VLSSERKSGQCKSEGNSFTRVADKAVALRCSGLVEGGLVGEFECSGDEREAQYSYFAILSKKFYFVKILFLCERALRM